MPNEIHTPIKCIIIDDEPLARDVVRRYIEMIPELNLKGEFGNAIEATSFLQEQSVDLIFSDIKMPQLTGIEFVRSLREVPKIIFTTAFKDYAYDGFELDVTDYLLKPIRFERFLKAVNKAIPQIKQYAAANEITTGEKLTPSEPFILLRVERKMKKILLDEILYIESDRDYLKVFTDQGCVITRQTIASLEAMLSESQFVRIHRSFIVSLSKLKSYTTEAVQIGDKNLPIGKLYRNSFLKSLDK